MSQVPGSKKKLVSVAPSSSASFDSKTDMFGNRIDPVVGFAWGSIIRSSIDEAVRLRHGQATAAQRAKTVGTQSIGVFTGNQRYFPINPDDIATLCEEWIGPGLCAEELRQVAVQHMGGQATDTVAVFNRTSAGIIATIVALASGRSVVSVVPPGGRSHTSAIRGSRIAGATFVEIQADKDWRQVIDQNQPVLVVITTVTSSLELLEDRTTVEVIQYAHSFGAKVFLDEAYGARLRPVLHGGQLIDLCINNVINQRKKEGRSDCRMQPRSFSGEERMPSMERRMSSISSSSSLGQLLASSRLASDQTPSSGFSSGA